MISSPKNGFKNIWINPDLTERRLFIKAENMSGLTLSSLIMMKNQENSTLGFSVMVYLNLLADYPSNLKIKILKNLLKDWSLPKNVKKRQINQLSFKSTSNRLTKKLLLQCHKIWLLAWFKIILLIPCSRCYWMKSNPCTKITKKSFYCMTRRIKCYCQSQYRLWENSNRFQL